MEELHSLVEVVHHILLRVVIVVAVRFYGADAGAMLVPLMLP
jgi:hypothetical protein